mmetsp:Transcript_15123/g.34356  ORF Transcript_15123/g.34356 Transcript_15123/m.34356 type:complete len:304 (+) Transcript_15123:171-1082(+)
MSLENGSFPAQQHPSLLQLHLLATAPPQRFRCRGATRAHCAGKFPKAPGATPKTCWVTFSRPSGISTSRSSEGDPLESSWDESVGTSKDCSLGASRSTRGASGSFSALRPTITRSLATARGSGRTPSFLDSSPGGGAMCRLSATSVASGTPAPEPPAAGRATSAGGVGSVAPAAAASGTAKVAAAAAVADATVFAGAVGAQPGSAATGVSAAAGVVDGAGASGATVVVTAVGASATGAVAVAAGGSAGAAVSTAGAAARWCGRSAAGAPWGVGDVVTASGAMEATAVTVSDMRQWVPSQAHSP